MKRLALLLGALTAMSTAVFAQAAPSPSAALVEALAAARASDMAALVAWAQRQSGPAAADPSITPVVSKILALAPPDRDALLFWLDAHGRRGLHAQGLTDAQIGVPYYPIDYTIAAAPLPGSITPLAIPPPPTPIPTPQPQHHSNLGFLGAVLPWVQVPVASSSSSSTSTTTSPSGNEIEQTTNSSSTSVSVGVNPGAIIAALADASAAHGTHASASPPAWRPVKLLASPLSDPTSPVTITHGFAAVHNDGSGGTACVAFANQSTKPVAQVDVDFEILNGLGLIKNVAPLRRAGTIAPGAEAGGDVGPQTDAEQRANCVPFSGATSVEYAVRQVIFADGTAWLQPGANAWPAP